MRKRSFLITFLKFVGNIIPGNYLKTFIYLNFIVYPRKIIRLTLTSFYRIDHIYDVIKEFKLNYNTNFFIFLSLLNRNEHRNRSVYGVIIANLINNQWQLI